MKSLASVLFVAAAVATAPVPAFSETPTIAPDTFVRVQASVDAKPIRGKVISMDDQTLTLRSDPAPGMGGPRRAIQIPIADVRSIEVRQTKGGGALAGVLGGAAGAVLSWVIVSAGCQSGNDDMHCFGNAVFATVPGIAVGALLGTAATRQTTWTQVPLDGRRVSIGVAPAPGRGWKAAVSVGF
jgi:hypothetical protein